VSTSQSDKKKKKILQVMQILQEKGGVLAHIIDADVTHIRQKQQWAPL
jgi:hypothetical protein